MTCRGMSTLAEYIKTQPPRPLGEWAADLGISRPYLHALMHGDRMPSVVTAKRIQDATGGAVPVTAWPNFAALLDGPHDRGAA